MTDYLDLIQTCCTRLGIPHDHAARRGLTVQPQATVLTPLGLDALGRDQFATPDAAQAWHAMSAAARADGCPLLLVSVFRSVAYQTGLIERKLAQGETIESILQVSAVPGYSEHHTGRAFDIAAPGDKPLEESFEGTASFDWLTRHAGRFGFRMSYPRGNSEGYLYEPWHWLWVPPAS